jgi:hypothetical protein
MMPKASGVGLNWAVQAESALSHHHGKAVHLGKTFQPKPAPLKSCLNLSMPKKVGMGKVAVGKVGVGKDAVPHLT